MFVIYWTTECKYYSDNNNCHWSKTVNGAATFKTTKAASNFIQSALKYQAADEVLEIIEVTSTELDVPELTQEEAEQAYEKLYQAAQLFGEAMVAAPMLVQHYTKQLSDENKRQEDLLHKFEFTQQNSFLYVRLGKMVNACRKRRREAKDCLNYIKSITEASPMGIFEVSKKHEYTMKNRSYAPRIENELF